MAGNIFQEDNVYWYVVVENHLELVRSLFSPFSLVKFS